MNSRVLALTSLALGCQRAPPASHTAAPVAPHATPVAPRTARASGPTDGDAPCRPRVELRTVEAQSALLFRLCEDGRLYSGATRFGQLDALPTSGGLREELRLISSHETLFIDPAAPAGFVVEPDGTLGGGATRPAPRRLTSDGRVLDASWVSISVAPDGVIFAGNAPTRYRAVPTTAEARRYAALLTFVMHSLMQ